MNLSERKEELAWACRILHLNGQTDHTLGHISARIPGTDHLLMKPKGLGFDEITPADIITVDLDGKQVDGTRPMHFETPIHTEIYRHRPDVGCILHAHPAYGTALAATREQRLPIVSHDAVLFADGLHFYNGSPELVVQVGHGEELVAAMGSGHTLLLRHHGTIIATSSVPWAVITAIVLERSIAMYERARSLGDFDEIDDATARAMYASKYNEQQIREYWDYWVRHTARAGFGWGLPALRPAWNGKR